ncbi:MAG: right-handed parallel beta-helix repeat-containing protein [Actinomycetota bacterium]
MSGALATARPASAATQITSCPFVITQPGQYSLAQNLACSGDGITILADNVHLNLAGFTLTGPNTGAGVGVRIRGVSTNPVTGVHINGGVVEKFGIGIFLEYARKCRVNGVASQDSPFGALAGDGIKLERSHNNQINGSRFTRNSGFGVRLVDSDGNKLNGNTVTENVGPRRNGGFFITEGSTGNHILGCDISRNGEVGVWIFDQASGDNTIQGCWINDNDVLADSALAGLVVVSSENTVRGNEVSRNRSGISISNRAVSNLIQGNTALDNLTRDMQDFNSLRCVNTWKNNSFVIDNEDGADFGPGVGCIR